MLESGRLNRRLGGCALIKDAFALPCSGGGLAAGCAIALAEVAPGTELLAVGPEGFDDTLRSLAACPLLSNTGARWSVCDAWLAPSPGRLTFAVNRQHGTKAVAVADDSTRMAVAALVAAFGLVAEPGGAIALGAPFADVSLARGRTTVVVVTACITDTALFTNILRGTDDFWRALHQEGLLMGECPGRLVGAANLAEWGGLQTLPHRCCSPRRGPGLILNAVPVALATGADLADACHWYERGTSCGSQLFHAAA